MTRKDLIYITCISLLLSILASTVTYFLAVKKIPKFATVDLLYLNNNFIVGLSKYKLENGSSDAEVAAMVRNYSKNIDPLLQDISKSGNLILFQKQAIVTKADDITDQVARAVFQNPISTLNSGENATKE
jgi:hypothetical protein